jgi:hypothetical protein
MQNCQNKSKDCNIRTEAKSDYFPMLLKMPSVEMYVSVRFLLYLINLTIKNKKNKKLA